MGYEAARSIPAQKAEQMAFSCSHTETISVRDARNPYAQQQRPENKEARRKEPGKYHPNPGNMSGKTVEITKDEPERENNVGRIKSRSEKPHERR